jgi:hypothetical protein
MRYEMGFITFVVKIGFQNGSIGSSTTITYPLAVIM